MNIEINRDRYYRLPAIMVTMGICRAAIYEGVKRPIAKPKLSRLISLIKCLWLISHLKTLRIHNNQNY